MLLLKCGNESLCLLIQERSNIIKACQYTPTIEQAGAAAMKLSAF